MPSLPLEGHREITYTSRRPTELEVDGVHIVYTVYAKTENRRGCTDGKVIVLQLLK